MAVAGTASGTVASVKECQRPGDPVVCGRYSNPCSVTTWPKAWSGSPCIKAIAFEIGRSGRMNWVKVELS